jgi:hypothetical protein
MASPDLSSITAAALFALLWDDLVDVLGVSATASIVRRAAKRAAADRPELGQLTIHKRAFEYEYVVPPQWSQNGPKDSLCRLVDCLVPILRELTGGIVIQRLRSHPQLSHACKCLMEMEVTRE